MSFLVYKIERDGVLLYVGATTLSLKNRWRPSSLRKKFGDGVFFVRVLDSCLSKEAMHAAEVRRIAELKPPFNRSSGGPWGGAGVKRSAEHVEALRQVNLGKPMSAKAREALARVVRKGVPKSEAHRAAIGAANKGRKLSPETRSKISAAAKRFHSKGFSRAVQEQSGQEPSS